MRLNMEISKTAVSLASKATRKNVKDTFCIYFHYVIVHTKTAMSIECKSCFNACESQNSYFLTLL